MNNEIGKSKVDAMVDGPLKKWLLTPSESPKSKDCEAIAQFMGWEKHPDFDNAYSVPGFGDPKTENDFATDYNLFVEAWNKAVDDLCANHRHAKAQQLFTVLDELHWKFTIETRLPILLQIINFLNKHDKQ